MTASVQELSDAVSLRSVIGGYRGTRVLDGVSLRIRKGEFVGVVGPSGCGKTSLLRALTGQLELYGGTVSVLGAAVRSGRAPRGVGYVPQIDRIDPDFPLTVEQVVLFGDAATSSRSPWFTRRERDAARGVLERLGLGGFERRRIAELSGGQRQRLLLARALARRAELVLLDEPTSGVDLATSREILEVLRGLNADGLTVLVTTHDLNFVAAHLPRIACLARTGGSLVADGAPTEVLTPSVLERTYGVPLRVLRDGGRVIVIEQDFQAPVGRELRTPVGEVAS